MLLLFCVVGDVVVGVVYCIGVIDTIDVGVSVVDVLLLSIAVVWALCIMLLLMSTMARLVAVSAC